MKDSPLRNTQKSLLRRHLFLALCHISHIRLNE